tara:strand:- start:1082 stop:1408 length:327 start_codon:yes stop_codon:yes gene_type:complete
MIAVQEKNNEPWGYEVIWACSIGNYMSKLVVINEEKIYPTIKDLQKEESIRILKGELKISQCKSDNLDQKIVYNLHPGHAFYFTPGFTYEFSPNKSPVEMTRVGSNFD